MATQLELAGADGALTPADPQRDAWFITKLVMAVFHHYAFAEGPDEVAAIGDELWGFCLTAVGGRAH